MIALQDIQRIFFIGIGGIGMSALARYFHHKGVQVSGYDRGATPLTRQLEGEGIAVHYYDDVALLDKSAQLVVYTPAIPAAHTQLSWYRARNYTVVKRSEVLGIITAGSFNICVAGTHGKTTISTMIAHLLRHTGYGCNAFLGGISANYNTNFWADDSQVCVVEADEYDRSFLKLHPDVAVISAMDPDHLDIYGTPKAFAQGFIDFAGCLKPGGILLRHHSLQALQQAMVRRQLTYSRTATPQAHHCEDAHHDHDHVLHHHQPDMPDVHTTYLEPLQRGYRFGLQVAGEAINDLWLPVSGLHNVENMTAAIAVARLLKIEVDKIREAVATYKGVRRRFEYVLATEGMPLLIDDYAHHPDELEALLRSVRHMYPDQKVTVFFQPHLYSRTRDFAAGFGKALSLADTAVLLPIYPARELPIEGVSAALIAEHMQQAVLLQKDEITDWMKTHSSDIWITAGAGDIDAMVEVIKNELIAQYTVNK
jgi:UDP-N-acetylmuramate--alanine ligase